MESGVWQHNPMHRSGVPYSDAAAQRAIPRQRPPESGPGAGEPRPASQFGGERFGNRSVPQSQPPARNGSAFGNMGNGNAVREQSDHGFSSLGPARTGGGGGAATRLLPPAAAEDGGAKREKRTRALTRNARRHSRCRDSRTGLRCSLPRPPSWRPLLCYLGKPRRTFSTPQEAAQALTEAASKNDTEALLKLFGPAGRPIVVSGDPAEDKSGREEFTRMAHEKLTIEQSHANRAEIVVGDQEWPFPVPLVRRNGQWMFDSAAGKVEVLARRVGAMN